MQSWGMFLWGAVTVLGIWANDAMEKEDTVRAMICSCVVLSSLVAMFWFFVDLAKFLDG